MNEELKKAIEERDKFLEKYPQLKSYQKQIDKKLNEVSPQERLSKILSMICDNQSRILDETKKVKDITSK